MSAYTEILFDVLAGKGGDLGIILLNRPQALNSLSHEMINRMYAQLQTWAKDSGIKGVVIRAAEGRAFCAGGDIKLTYERHKKNDPAVVDFFRDEYQLNRLIFHFPKPYIAFLDGITMGGGVGVSIHGSHRIATDRLVFAMPETTIGFYPDVGGTYFLPRLPGYTGFYLGLTGARINSDDCLALGIVQQKVAQHSLITLLDALAQHPFDDDSKTAVTHVISQFKVQSNESKLTEQQALIDDVFSRQTVEEIIQALQLSSDPFLQETYQVLQSKSPTSLKVTLKALQEAAHLDFDSTMQQEFKLTNHFLRAHDFIEGIRALIIDKDQAPHWQPAKLEQVTDQQVNDYFKNLDKSVVNQ